MVAVDAKDLKRLFPNISESVVALSVGDTGTAPKLERPTLDAALGPSQAQERHSGRFHIRITSVRTRLLDPDNLAEKYHLDCLRYAGIIPADTPEQISLETTQRRKAKGEDEKVIIEVWRL